MHLKEVEHHHAQSPWGHAIEAMSAAGIPVPKIMSLFNYKPQWTTFLAQFTQQVMRGDSPLLPGERELIAAFTSRVNDCEF